MRVVGRGERDEAGPPRAPRAVLVALHSSAPGGAQAMGLAEAEAFSRRCKVIVVAPPGPLRDRAAEFAEVLPEAPSLPTWDTTPFDWGKRFVKSCLDAFRLARVIRRKRVDAVVTCSTVLWSPVLAARLVGARSIVHAREWPVSRLGRAVFWLQRQTADVIVAISAGVAARFAGRGHARIVRIPDGIDARPVEPTPARIDGPLRLLVVGSLTGGDGKGQHRAVETLAELRRRGVDADLSIVGPILDEAYAETVRATIRRAGMDEWAIVTGPSNDVPGLLRDHDVLLFCSRQGADVTPLVLMEALAHERPVVAAGVGSVAEVLGDGTYGTVVTPEDPAAMADALIALRADPAAARAQAARGRTHVITNFDRATGIDRLADLVFAG
jgi:glycosyltransferase involved in cell wall biosynthesis